MTKLTRAYQFKERNVAKVLRIESVSDKGGRGLDGHSPLARQEKDWYFPMIVRNLCHGSAEIKYYIINGK